MARGGGKDTRIELELALKTDLTNLKKSLEAITKSGAAGFGKIVTHYENKIAEATRELARVQLSLQQYPTLQALNRVRRGAGHQLASAVYESDILPHRQQLAARNRALSEARATQKRWRIAGARGERALADVADADLRSLTEYDEIDPAASKKKLEKLYRKAQSQRKKIKQHDEDVERKFDFVEKQQAIKDATHADLLKERVERLTKNYDLITKALGEGLDVQADELEELAHKLEPRAMERRLNRARLKKAKFEESAIVSAGDAIAGIGKNMRREERVEQRKAREAFKKARYEEWVGIQVGRSIERMGKNIRAEEEQAMGGWIPPGARRVSKATGLSLKSVRDMMGYGLIGGGIMTGSPAKAGAAGFGGAVMMGGGALGGVFTGGGAAIAGLAVGGVRGAMSHAPNALSLLQNLQGGFNIAPKNQAHARALQASILNDLGAYGQTLGMNMNESLGVARGVHSTGGGWMGDQNVSTASRLAMTLQRSFGVAPEDTGRLLFMQRQGMLSGPIGTTAESIAKMGVRARLEGPEISDLFGMVGRFGEQFRTQGRTTNPWNALRNFQDYSNVIGGVQGMRFAEAGRDWSFATGAEGLNGENPGAQMWKLQVLGGLNLRKGGATGDDLLAAMKRTQSGDVDPIEFARAAHKIPGLTPGGSKLRAIPEMRSIYKTDDIALLESLLEGKATSPQVAALTQVGSPANAAAFGQSGLLGRALDLTMPQTRTQAETENTQMRAGMNMLDATQALERASANLKDSVSGPQGLAGVVQAFTDSVLKLSKILPGLGAPLPGQ